MEEKNNMVENNNEICCKKCTPKLKDYYIWTTSGITLLLFSNKDFIEQNKFECKYCHKEQKYDNKIKILMIIQFIIKSLTFLIGLVLVTFLENLTIRILCICSVLVINSFLPTIGYYFFIRSHR